MIDTITRNFLSHNSYLSVNVCNDIINSLHTICKRNNIDYNKIYSYSVEDSMICFNYYDKVIKILPSIDSSVGISEYVKDSKYILQPIDEIMTKVTINNNFSFIMSVIVENNLNIDKNINDEELVNLSNRLYSDGYAWVNINKNNIGYDADNVLKAFDYGQLYNKRYDLYYSKHLEYHNNRFESLCSKQKKRRLFKY